jgi:hypothetical protein
MIEDRVYCHVGIQSSRPPCFIRAETGRRSVRVVYDQAKGRLNMVRLGCGFGSLMFCPGGDRCFQGSHKLPARLGDAPTATVPQHKSIAENFKLRRSRRQLPHPVGPIRSA